MGLAMRSVFRLLHRCCFARNVFLLILVCNATISTAHGQAGTSSQRPVALELGQSIEAEISGKASDDYDLAIDAGQAAVITAEQDGIDIVVSVADAEGKVLADFDSEPRLQGEEHVLVTTDSANSFRIRIQAKYSKAARGKYRIRLIDLHPATDKDRRLFEAHELSTHSRSLSRDGKFDEARALATQALDSAEKAVGPNDAYTGELLVNSAELERTKDNLVQSEEMFKRALAVDEQALGDDHPQTAFAELRLGALYDAIGEYTKAEALFEKAMATNERILGSNHPILVVCLMNLALVHENRQDYGKALPELQRALAIAEQQLDSDDFLQAAVVNNLGDLYRSSRQYEQAEPLVERTIQMLEKLKGPNSSRLIEPLENLSVILREKKDYAGALQALARAQTLADKAYGPQSSQSATVLILRGNVYRAQGEYEKALDDYRRARGILEIAAGPYHRLTQLTYVNAAIAYAALGDTIHASEEQQRADALLEDSIELNLAIGSEREKFKFLQGTAERTDRTISNNALLDTNSPAAADLAALVILQRKGRVLDAMSGSLAVLRQHMSPEDQKLLDELNSTTADFAKLALHGAGRTSADDFRNRLSALGQRREELEAEISQRSSEFRTQTRAVTLEEVKAAIPNDAALLEFASYRPFDPKADSSLHAYSEPHYIVYILTNRGEVHWKELGPAQPIDDAVNSLRVALRDPTRQDAGKLARSLDSRVMQPLRPLLDGARQLLISPDGALDLIPFEVMVDENGKYLIERYSITYLTTGRDLLRLQGERTSRSSPVIVADPFFGEAGSPADGVNGPHQKKTSRLAQRRSLTSANNLSEVYFAPLAGTAGEASAIKSQFPDARMLTGSQATEKAVKQIEGPSILHIATHGFFLADLTAMREKPPASAAPVSDSDSEIDNPLLRSGLALAGANVRHSGSRGGILTALEASNLDLRGTKLVTLSACDTGIGEIRNGEGVYGLRRAFFLAGAESVVMSLWPVSDYSTRELMSSYYRLLKRGMGRGEALRQSKLAMLKRKGRKHPFYWASFIQSGEWANLQGKRDP